MRLLEGWLPVQVEETFMQGRPSEDTGSNCVSSIFVDVIVFPFLFCSNISNFLNITCASPFHFNFWYFNILLL